MKSGLPVSLHPAVVSEIGCIHEGFASGISSVFESSSHSVPRGAIVSFGPVVVVVVVGLFTQTTGQS